MDMIITIIVFVAGILGVAWGWGKSRERKGRREAQAESKEAVREVETIMKKKVDKPRTVDETRRRLDRGDF